MSESRFNYIKNVLGIRQVMVPENLSSMVEEKVELTYQIRNHGNILFLEGFQGDQTPSFTIEEMQLLEKIIVALKLKFQKVDIAKYPKSIATKTLAPYLGEYEYVFILGEEKKSLLHSENEFSGIRFFHTFGVSEMIKNPDLKKDAWIGFKAIMENLPR